MTRRFGAGFRIAFVVLAIALVAVAVEIVLTAVSHGGLSLVPVALLPILLGSALFTAGLARSKVVASADDVTITNPLRTYRLSWAEIEQVDPGRDGMLFRLGNGKTINAFSVARSGWRFGRLRYDADALSYYRSHLVTATHLDPPDEAIPD
jgi:hypothetical protein